MKRHMRMMKRIMTYCLLFVLVGTVLAGCGKKTTQPDDTQVQTSEIISYNPEENSETQTETSKKETTELSSKDLTETSTITESITNTENVSDTGTAVNTEISKDTEKVTDTETTADTEKVTDIETTDEEVTTTESLTATENTTEATTTEQEVRTFAQEYGVFLGVEEEDIIKRSVTYHMIAVDGQGISKETVSRLHEDGHIVYAYLDIGSLEIYRDYYEQFRDLALGEYENWPDEYWVDVSDAGWQDYIVHVLAGDFNERGYDGLFLDNADVYYYYPKEEIYQGLVTILQGLRGYDMKLMINGADVFVSRLIEENKGNLIDSVNQESVFSGIQDYEKDIFKETDAEDREYYMDYLDHVFHAGIEVYLLEYTKDPDVVEEIRVYCAEHGYQYYASPRVALL